MKTFKQHLTEGLSPILYHSTNFISASRILSKDFFKLAADIGTSSEVALSKKDKYYYLSTTRHKLGGYSLDPWYNATMLVLDGRKFSERYKGAPVDYWGQMRSTDTREAEDRIYHNKPIIPKASSYIMEIHILLRENLGTLDLKDSKALRELYKQALIKKIPVYFYHDKETYLILNKNKSEKIDLKQLEVLIEPIKPWVHIGKNPFKIWEELYYTPISKEKSLSKEAQKLLYNVKFGPNDYKAQSIIRQLQNDIHNNKGDPDLIDKIISIFRKERIKEAIDFVKILSDKWGMWKK